MMENRFDVFTTNLFSVWVSPIVVNCFHEVLWLGDVVEWDTIHCLLGYYIMGVILGW